jgi:hypothetical protein
MVAIALLAVVIVTVLGGFSSAALATNRHRQGTDLDRLTRSDAEYIKSQTYRAKPAVYGNLAASGYAFSTQVLYYNPLTGSFSAANPETGLQQVVLTVSTTSGGLSEQLDFMKVRP